MNIQKIISKTMNSLTVWYNNLNKDKPSKRLGICTTTFGDLLQHSYIKFISEYLATPIFVYFLIVVNFSPDSMYLKVFVILVLLVSALSNLCEFKNLTFEEIEEAEEKIYKRFFGYVFLTIAYILAYITLSLNHYSLHNGSAILIYIAFIIANLFSLYHIENAKLKGPTESTS